VALGAGWSRLVRGVIFETLITAAAGSVVGLGVAAATLRVFVRAAAGVVPRLEGVALDGPTLAAIPVITVMVALLCGAVPAWHAARADMRPLLHSATATTPSVWRIRASLVIGQIAVSIVLLVGAGLLARSVIFLLHEDAGFEPARGLATKLVLSDVTLLDGGQRDSFVRDLLDRVRALPGVLYAGLGSTLPPQKPPITIGVRLVGDNRDEFHFMAVGSVTPGYMAALGTRFVSGRDFEDSDARTGQGAVLLSESSARFFFEGQDAVGGVVRPLPPIVPKTMPRVVGVVRDIKYAGLDVPPGLAVYVPWADRPIGTSYLVVRTAGDPRSLAPSVRRIIGDLDASVPVQDMRPLEDVLAGSIAERRLRVMPAILFGVLALALALVGVMGTLARAVAERRQELAIRAALGASSRELMAIILTRGAALTGGGLTLGLAAAIATGHGLAPLLYGVPPSDPPTFALVVMLVGIGAMVASYLPARRAAHVDPIAHLRAE
jgi:putative ABC transport system permease protein